MKFVFLFFVFMFNQKQLIEMKTKWKDLSIKEKLAIGSACLAFFAGWALTICAAFVPLLLSEQGVLWILGQSLVYSASVFGVSLYFKAETVQMKHDIERFFDRRERMQLQREKIRKGIDVPELPEEEDEE